MPALVNVVVHESRSPDQLQQLLKHSLQNRQIAHTLHYQSHQQAEKWHALHLTHAPVNTDSSYAQVYDSAYARVVQLLAPEPLQVIGLCCGYADKEIRLLQHLRPRIPASFLACDGGLAMVLHAAEQAGKIVGAENCRRLLFDFQTTSDFPECLDSLLGKADARLFTCFGSIHAFEPEMIFSRLAGFLRPNDLLLMNANLAPSIGYPQSIQVIIPQYDNPLTRSWLSQFLIDLGLPAPAGKLRVLVEPSPVAQDLHRIAIYFDFLEPCSITVAGEHFKFHADESLRLFYSYRYTPQLVHHWLCRHGLSVRHQGLIDSLEEGVLLCSRKKASSIR